MNKEGTEGSSGTDCCALQGNGNALAMVTAIIDGTGSLGACITGVAITWLSNQFDTSGCGGDGSTGGFDGLAADFDAR